LLQALVAHCNYQHIFMIDWLLMAHSPASVTFNLKRLTRYSLLFYYILLLKSHKRNIEVHVGVRNS